MLSGNERRRLDEIASQLWQEDRKWAEGLGTGRPHRPRGTAGLRRPRPWLAVAAALWLATGVGIGTLSWWAFAPGAAALLTTLWLFTSCLPGRVRPDRPPRRHRRHPTP